MSAPDEKQPHGVPAGTEPGDGAGGGPYRKHLTRKLPRVPHTGPLAWMAKNSVASNILMAILVVGGLITMMGVKEEVFPEVDIETVIISVPYPGASPEEVEQGVVLAVEEAVRGLDGVKEVRGTANEGAGTIAVELLTGTDSDRALNDVKSAVDRVTSLPEDAERPIISLVSTRQQVISLVLYGDVSDHVLHDMAERVRYDMLNMPEITYVEVSGTRPLEISVEVPQDQLRAQRLTLGQIAGAIRQASVEIPGGSVDTSAGEVLLRTDERRDFGSEYGEIVLRSRPDGSVLRVRDVAEIDDGFEESDLETYYNGQPAVMVQAFRTGDQGPIEIANAVKAYAHDLSDALPPGMSVDTWNDRSQIYRDRIDLLVRNGLMGLVLVLLALGLFLEPTLAFWVTMGIPISFLGAFLVLPRWDVSINMISLFAFIVTLGIVVDDAIVVGESIFHKRRQGYNFVDAAVAGVREVAVPVTFSVITTIVAFSPLLFVPGVMGKFMVNMPVVVISVLAISLIESVLVLPAHLSHTMKLWLKYLLFVPLLPLRLLHMLRFDDKLEVFVAKVYKPVLQFALRWRYITIGFSLALFLGALGLAAGGRIPFSFMPKVEGDVITLQLRMPVGTPVEETRAIEEHVVTKANEILGENGGDSIRRGLFSQVGVATGFGGGPMGAAGSTGSHLATVMLYLVQSDQRPITTAAFADEWRERIGEIPGAEALTIGYSIGANAGSPIDIRLSHPDNTVLEAAAERLAGEIANYGGLRDIDSGVSPGKEQLTLSLTPEGRARGLDETELARQVRAAFYGSEAVRQQRGREEIRVYVRLPREERVSMANVENFIVRTPDGGEMPLHQAAHIERGRAYTVIKRIDGRRVISVTADIIDGVGNADQVMESLVENELPRLLADVHGLSWETGGEQKERAESLGALGVGFIGALLGIFGLLAIVFRSYVQPIIVMSAIPFGIVGAFFGHFLMGYELSFISVMGIIALGGVVVNDSLVMIDAINRFRDEGMLDMDAIVAGGTRRFRPILLTSLTTFFGLLPMIFEPSVQARFLIPMAISLGFGVLFATGILLFLVPSLYAAIQDIKHALGIHDEHDGPEPEEYDDEAPDEPRFSDPGPGDGPGDDGPGGGLAVGASLPGTGGVSAGGVSGDAVMARTRQD